MQTPNLNFALSGAILPKIVYLDANQVQQTLLFRMPPTDVSPVAPVPVRSDSVASDGTMWTLEQYTEAYLQMSVTVLIGDDLTNWINFLTAAVGGQVMTFYPDQTLTNSHQVRMMVQGSSNTNNSNVPTGDPELKRAGVGRFTARLVFRFETPSDAAPCFQQLNNWS